MSADKQGFESFKAIVAHRQLAAAPRIFIDVGANVGQTVIGIRDAFPLSVIYAIEPVPAAFSRLQAATGGMPNVTLENIALGARSGTVTMTAQGASTGNSILNTALPANIRVVDVPMDTGDNLVARHSIDHVDYLKIDTEGYDLSVLAGFKGSLLGQCIDFVEVEAGLSRDNKRHVAFEELKSFLEDNSYRLLQIKEVVSDQHFSGLANLRRCNIVFASKALLERSRIEPTRLKLLARKRVGVIGGGTSA